MGTRLKTKLTLGLSFLFIVILSFGILGIFYINRLSKDAKLILKDNHITLKYCNNMLIALEELPGDSAALKSFEQNLSVQEKNITEAGENDATKRVRSNFEQLKKMPTDSSNYKDIRRAIFQIQEVNEEAIVRKNAVAAATAEQATFWLTVIVTVLTIIAFTFIINFPGIISNPIKVLSEGIAEIANKNYSKRIHLEQNDEFGELAAAFNSMASKLDEYEHSNLAKIVFEKTRIETIINQMKDGIIGLDEKQHVLFLNVFAENLLGLKEQEILGKYAPDIALKNDLMRTILQDAEKKELKIYADGKESFFNKEPIKVLNAGVVIGEVIVLRNITPFHELDEAKTHFIATVSHELKTPISSIKMSARLLKDDRVGSLGDEQKELVKSIEGDVERLLKITSELLNMAQVETGNIQLKLQSTSPESIVQQAVGTVQMLAQQKGIQINCHVQQHIGNMHADEEKTSWVLLNFLTNAIKFSPENTVIEVHIYFKNNRIEFLVEDQGKGIEEKYLPRIFDRYFIVPGTKEKTGTGLGLSISREFIEAQGGHIWVSSMYGQGSTFGFSLPVA